MPRTIRFEERTRLPVSAAEAWDVVADVGRWSEWTDQLAAEPGRPRPVAGERLALLSRMATPWYSPLAALRLRVEVEQAEAGARFGWSGRLFGVAGRHGFEFTDLGAEGCEVVQWEELSGWATRLVQWFGVWRHMRRAFRRLLRDLRNHVATQRLGARKVLEVEGARVAYVDEGEGQPVLFLHGYPQSLYCWRHQLVACQRTWRVIAPDLPGWGQSDRRLDLDHRYPAEVDRVIAFVERLGLSGVQVVAHDYGGYLALGMVKRRPDLFTSLAILNSRAHGTFRARWNLCFVPLLRWPGRLLPLRLAKWLPVGPIHRLTLAKERRTGVFGRVGEAEYLDPLAPGAPGSAWLIRFFSPGRGYEFQPQPELRQGVSAALRTCVIWGARDTYLPTRIAEELAEALPNCTLQLLPEAGHYVLEEEPDGVNAALLAHLRGAD